MLIHRDKDLQVWLQEMLFFGGLHYIFS